MYSWRRKWAWFTSIMVTWPRSRDLINYARKPFPLPPPGYTPYYSSVSSVLTDETDETGDVDVARVSLLPPFRRFHWFYWFQRTSKTNETDETGEAVVVRSERLPITSVSLVSLFLLWNQ